MGIRGNGNRREGCVEMDYVIAGATIGILGFILGVASAVVSIIVTKSYLD